MAGQVRHLKVKNGRFYARLAVPHRVRQIIGKGELVAPLGADRRAALKALPAVVAQLQQRIAQAEQQTPTPAKARDQITTQDFGRAVWQRYTMALADDEATRASYPTAAEIEAERAKLVQRLLREGVPDDPVAVLNHSLDWLVLKDARAFDQNARKVRLDALRRELAANETHQVEHEIDDYLRRHDLTAPEGSVERITLARHLLRAEIEALQRTLERDRGDYGGQPADPIVKPPADGAKAQKPVSIEGLVDDYVTGRVQIGSMRDGGKRTRPVVKSLKGFLGHDDALADAERTEMERNPNFGLF